MSFSNSARQLEVPLRAHTTAGTPIQCGSVIIISSPVQDNN